MVQTTQLRQILTENSREESIDNEVYNVGYHFKGNTKT